MHTFFFNIFVMINVLVLYIVRIHINVQCMRPQTHRGEKRVTLTPLHLFDVVVVWWSWIDRLAGINAQMTLKRYSADVQWSKNKGKMQFGEVALIINHTLIKKIFDNKGDTFKNQDIMKLADTSEAKIEIGLNQLLIVALFVYFLNPVCCRCLTMQLECFPIYQSNLMKTWLNMMNIY